MSFLARPAVAAFAPTAMQRLQSLANRRAGGRGSTASWLACLPEYTCATRELAVPTPFGPARAVLYLPADTKGARPPAHVNFHGGGYVMPQIELDDSPLERQSAGHRPLLTRGISGGVRGCSACSP